jgi:Uma2 family endonuclease
MFGLEYALLFGVPGNKIELMRGRSRWAVPFLNRDEAEAHFTSWLETLVRWKQLDEWPKVRKSARRWKAEVAGITQKLYPRPIEIQIPIAWKAFDAFYDTFWWPDMWPGNAPGGRGGWLAGLDHQDVQMNLWRLFGNMCARHGGLHSGRVDIALSDTAAVAPDQYYFQKSSDECMIEGDYFCGVPDLIAEVLAPASRTIDLGPRKEVYRRAGVPHLWLVDPVAETIALHELAPRAYRHTATHGAGESFEFPLFPGEQINVDTLFDTQMKRHGDPRAPADPEPIPTWIIQPEQQLGLEYFFLLGHPERRWEIWGNRAPSMLAFGSSEEAQARFAHFLEEICRWEQAPQPVPATLETDLVQAEVGRFRLTQRGRHVHLDVVVDARQHQEWLRVWGNRKAWDWGEK